MSLDHGHHELVCPSCGKRVGGCRCIEGHGRKVKDTAPCWDCRAASKGPMTKPDEKPNERDREDADKPWNEMDRQVLELIRRKDREALRNLAAYRVKLQAEARREANDEVGRAMADEYDKGYAAGCAATSEALK